MSDIIKRKSEREEDRRGEIQRVQSSRREQNTKDSGKKVYIRLNIP